MTSKIYSLPAALFDGLWPFHLKPYPGELLSSWLIRLAHSHGYKVETACRLLLGRGAAMWQRDIDRFGHPHLLQVLAQTTAITLRAYENTLLSSYEGVLAENLAHSGTGRWLVSLGIYHRTRRKCGLMYCRQCIAQDEDPYFRKKWRLACFTTCSEHQIDLQDCCPGCGSALMPHRVDVGYKNHRPSDRLLVRCHSCGHDLREGNDRPSSPLLLAMANDIENCLDQGWLEKDGFTLHALAYMNGLRILLKAARLLVTPANAEVTGAAIPEKAEFEHLDLSQRRHLMTELGRTLAGGIGNIANYLRTGGVRYSDVVTSEQDTPSWLVQALTPIKRWQHPARSDAELASIAAAMEARSAAGAFPAFRVDLPPSRLPRSLRRGVSNEAYEHLMASLDQDVGSTFDEQYRFGYLQDKVMFALLRNTKLVTRDLAEMRISELDRPSSTPVNFEIEARSAEQAKALLQWHVNHLRPRLDRGRGISSVFISPFTHKPMGATAIQARFKAAVKRAALTASISSLSHFRRISV